MERKGSATRGVVQQWAGAVSVGLTTVLVLSNAGALPRSTAAALVPSVFLLGGFVFTDAAELQLPKGLLLGLYLLAVVLHAALQTSANLTHPVLTPLLSLFLPLFPDDWQYPAESQPLPLPSLLPSFLILSQSVPMLLQVVPPAALERRRRFVLYFSIAVFANFCQTAYTEFHGTLPWSLYDVAVFAPFRLQVPAFFVGIMLARLLQSTAPDPASGRTGPLFGACLASLAALLVLLARSSLYGPQLLLIPVSAIIYFASVFTLRSQALPTVAASEREIARATFSRNYVSMICLCAYVLQNSTWSMLNMLLCSSASHGPRALCVTDRYDWLYGMGSTVRARPPLAIFLAVLAVTATVVGCLLLLILDCGSRADISEVLPAGASSLMNGHSHVAPSTVENYSATIELLSQTGERMAPAISKKSMGVGEVIVRLFLYYTFMTAFMVTVWRLSVPITFNLTRLGKHPFYCWHILHICSPKAGESEMSADMGKASEVVKFLVDVLRWTSILCLPAMIFNVLGHVLYPRIIRKDRLSVPEMLAAVSTSSVPSKPRGQQAMFDMDFVVYVRYVTRGNNPVLVGRNAREASHLFRAAGVPEEMFVIEIVTDKSLKLKPRELGEAAAYEIVVPEDYNPPGGALYKARALNYAIFASPARDQDWIVHLDEETRFDADTVAAIVEHCARQNYAARVAKTQEWPSIGQGPIVYGRSMVPNSRMPSSGLGNWITTLADSSRVSDDCGRYRVQYENGEVWVGMHGSFVVASNSVEKAVTFDHGLEGSIAEDAFFAMLARMRSVRFAWIDAYMYEQSPFTFEDFVKQRARWLVGGLKACSSERIPLLIRSGMLTMTGLWSLMPFTYFSLLLAILFGNIDPAVAGDRWYYHFVLPLMASISVWSYIFGFLVTFKVSDFGIFGFITLLYVQLALTPVFGLMEVCSVAYALWNFSVLSVAFHVVQKQGAPDAADLRAQGRQNAIRRDAIVEAEEGTPLLQGDR